MKALILSGGNGTRFFPFTKTVPKQILPVAGKPVLHYGVESMVKAGIKQIYVIVGRNGKKVKDALGNGRKWGVCIRYITQSRPLGLAHAVHVAREHLQGDDFVMWLGDTILCEEFGEVIRSFYKRKANALLVLGRTKKPEICGVARIKGNTVTHVVEKPDCAKTNLVLAGLYVFDGSVFNAAKKIRPSKRGELEITDAIQYLISHSYRVEAYVTKKFWIDVGCRKSWQTANAYFRRKTAS